jgi:hypothetical protein
LLYGSDGYGEIHLVEDANKNALAYVKDYYKARKRKAPASGAHSSSSEDEVDSDIQVKESQRPGDERPRKRLRNEAGTSNTQAHDGTGYRRYIRGVPIQPPYQSNPPPFDHRPELLPHDHSSGAHDDHYRGPRRPRVVIRDEYGIPRNIPDFELDPPPSSPAPSPRTRSFPLPQTMHQYTLPQGYCSELTVPQAYHRNSDTEVRSDYGARITQYNPYDRAQGCSGHPSDQMQHGQRSRMPTSNHRDYRNGQGFPTRRRTVGASQQSHNYMQQD